MFLSIEVNYIFFITFLFFVSLYMINYTNCGSGRRYNFSYYVFCIMIANLLIFYVSCPLNYVLFDIFFSDPNTFLIKLTILFFQFVFFTFIYISYKNYLKPEIFYFFNLSVASSLFLVSTYDYIITFVLLELSSMPIYALIALPKNRFAIEAAIKYLIFGSLASQLFILSYIFFSNTFATNDVSDLFFYSLFSSVSPEEQIFALFFFVSMFIKFGVGPFYNWLVDVYQASSYPLFVYNSTISKLIIFAPLYTIGQYFLGQTYYKVVFILLLLYSLIHSTINLFFQNNLRRFFGYSSVSNFSILIIAMFFSPDGAIVFFKYLTFYILLLFLTYVSFDIYRLISPDRFEPRFLEDISLVRTEPYQFFFALSIIFSSGLPPIGLFYAKAYTYGVILSGGSVFSYLLAALLIVISILSLFAYFRAISKAYDLANKVTYYTISVDNEDELPSLITLVILLTILIIKISFNWASFIAI